MLKSRQSISCGSAVKSAKREKSEVKQCPPPFFQEPKWLNLSYYIRTSFPPTFTPTFISWISQNNTVSNRSEFARAPLWRATTSQRQQQRAQMSHAQILDNKANTSLLGDVRAKLSSNRVRSKIERVDCLWRNANSNVPFMLTPYFSGSFLSPELKAKVA